MTTHDAVTLHDSYYLIHTAAWLNQRIGAHHDELSSSLQSFTGCDVFDEYQPAMDIAARMQLWCAANNLAVGDGAVLDHDSATLTEPITIVLAATGGPHPDALALVSINGRAPQVYADVTTDEGYWLDNKSIEIVCTGGLYWTWDGGAYLITADGAEQRITKVFGLGVPVIARCRDCAAFDGRHHRGDVPVPGDGYLLPPLRAARPRPAARGPHLHGPALMLTLRFPLPGVLLLAEHALAATTRAATMREVLHAAAPRPALWLIGDDGVFLMSNGLLTPANAEHTTGLPVVHAAGYPTQDQWLAVAGQLGRGTPLRIVLPLLDPTPSGRILHDDLTASATAGATALVIDLDTEHQRWHLPAGAIHGGELVTLLPMPDPIRRALSLNEMTAILGQIAGAVDVAKLLDITAAAVYDTLLADIGLSLASLPEGQQVDPRNFAIPTQQHTAIKTAVTHRAATEADPTALAIRLIDLLPSTYDDPSAPVPDLVDSGPGPGGMQMSLTREAVGVITAAGHHIQQLAHHYGPNSREHVTAATTWLAALAQIISASSGPRVRVARDGTLNLLVHTSGYTFAVIFHGDARQCIAGDGCQALISDDGIAHGPYANTRVAAHEHEPSFPLDAPRPGHWSTHS